MIGFYMDLQKANTACVISVEPVNPDVGTSGVMGVEVVRPTYVVTDMAKRVIQVSPPEYDAALWDNRVSPFLSDDGEALMFYCPDGPEAVVPVYVSDPDALLLDLFTNPG